MQAFAILPVWMWLGVSVIFFSFGEYFSKRFALAPGVSFVVLILIVNLLSTLTWLPAIFEENRIAIIGVLWILLGLVADLFIGLILFKEQLSPHQWAGLVLGTVSVLLLSF